MPWKHNATFKLHNMFTGFNLILPKWPYGMLILLVLWLRNSQTIRHTVSVLWYIWNGMQSLGPFFLDSEVFGFITYMNLSVISFLICLFFGSWHVLLQILWMMEITVLGTLTGMAEVIAYLTFKSLLISYRTLSLLTDILLWGSRL